MGLKQDHDKAVKLNLAVCMSAKQDRKKAMVMIQEAKRLDTENVEERHQAGGGHDQKSARRAAAVDPQTLGQLER